MPQFDISTFTPQVVWLAITFVVLYAVMARLGLPQVRAALDARRARLDGDLARAAEMKTAAEALLAAHDKVLAEARVQAQMALKEAADRFAADAAEQQRRLAASLAEQVGAAEQRIAATKEAAIGDIRGIAVDVGRSVVEKLVGTPPDEARMAAAVDDALRSAAALGERRH